MQKQKPLISATHAINWYIGNYLMNPNNSLRDDEKLSEKAFAVMENLRSKLSGKTFTHGEFLDFVKVSGIHEKFYRYQKPKPNDCEICRRLGIR